MLACTTEEVGGEEDTPPTYDIPDTRTAEDPGTPTPDPGPVEDAVDAAEESLDENSPKFVTWAGFKCETDEDCKDDVGQGFCVMHDLNNNKKGACFCDDPHLPPDAVDGCPKDTSCKIVLSGACQSNPARNDSNTAATHS